jgi:hypothetical protein
MPGRQCYHCKQWIEDGHAHDCWTTTEAALTQDLSEDLRDAWARLREAAIALGDQRIYASHKSIMFSRASCHFFVRPKRTYLELCVFLGRPLKAPQVRRVEPASRTKFAHLIPIRHRDEVESPITLWLEEAYALSQPTKPATSAAQAGTRPPRRGATAGANAKAAAPRAKKKTARPTTAKKKARTGRGD